MLNRPWWERHSQVLEDEEADLRDLADDAELVLNEDLLSRDQVRQYSLTHTCLDTALHLTVTFSDLHPYFRPEVIAEEVTGVHQNPYNGVLCLLEGDTWNWDIDLTVAEMIRRQLPRLLADRPGEAEPDSPTGKDRTEGAATDGSGDGHVEPYVNYFPAEEGAVLRVPDTTQALAGVHHGTLTVALDQQGQPQQLRGTVLEVRDGRKKVVWKAPKSVVDRYPKPHPRIKVPWARLPERPSENTPEAVVAAVVGENPNSAAAAEQPVGGGAGVSVVGAVFEDGLRPYERGDAWLFAVRGWKAPQQQSGRVRPDRETVGPYLARAYRADRRAMTERVPSVAALADKRVVVFGTGGVGAPLALEFARAGVGTLVVVDRDFADPGNACRWPLGFLVAGHRKAAVLADFIRWHWPHTEVAMFAGPIGQPRTVGGGGAHWAAVHECLDGADLVVDATAEVGMSYFLSDATREVGVPLIVVSATEGGWGGRVVHLGTGPHAPCWFCIEQHTLDGTLPIPPHDPDPATGSIHPGGCTTPTFTGTGFDIAAVSLGAMRLATSVLASETDGGYPAAGWNVAVYELRNATCALPGAGEPYTVSRHPDCESCNARLSG